MPAGRSHNKPSAWSHPHGLVFSDHLDLHLQLHAALALGDLLDLGDEVERYEELLLSRGSVIIQFPNDFLGLCGNTSLMPYFGFC